MMRQFNPNSVLADQLRDMVQKAGIILPRPIRHRDKVLGFMACRGQYTVGDCVIDTYGHYHDENDDRHYSLKFYKDKDAYWHLAVDRERRVWFSPTGCFNCNINSLTDWEPTPFTIK